MSTSMSQGAGSTSSLAPLAVDAKGAAFLMGVSESFWHQLHASGQVP